MNQFHKEGNPYNTMMKHVYGDVHKQNEHPAYQKELSEMLT